MKRILRLFLTLLMLVVCASGFAAEKTYSYTFKSGGTFTEKVQSKTFNGVTWAISTDAGYFAFSQGANQIGSKRKPGTNTTISTSDFSGTIKSVKVNGWNSNDANATVEVLVGQTSYGTKSFTTNTKDYDFLGSSTGNVLIKITNTAGAYFIKTISVTYEDGPAKTATTLDFGLTKKTLNIDETFTATATLKAGEATISGNVTYTSSKSEVATVNVTTGEVSALTAGTTRITANFAGNDNYAASTATYELTVVDPNAAEETFDFSKPAKYGKDTPEKNNETVIGVGNSIVSGIVSLTVTKESESSNVKSRFWNSRGEITYRLYKGAINTVSVPQGYVITAISITDNNNGKSKLVTIGENKDNSDWTGSAQSVQITATGSAVLETMTVTYSKLSSIGLDESKDNAETILGNADKTVNVKLTRTLKADVWNTFCVPFDVTVAGSPLEGATIKQIASVTEKDDGAVINFENAPATLEAGKAYLVRTATAIVNPTFNGVTVKNVTPTNCSGNEKYQLIGIYSPLNIDASRYGKVFGINNQDKLAKVMKDTSIKGMRAYFLLANSATAAKLNFGGELTGIDAVDNGEAVMTGKVYNLNGQYVGNSLEGLKKGVYVVNGKKVLK